jgi:hypothetical protein
MSLNSAQQNSLKEKLDGLKQSIQEELRQHNPESLQIQSGEGDRLTNDALNADEMAQYCTSSCGKACSGHRPDSMKTSPIFAAECGNYHSFCAFRGRADSRTLHRLSEQTRG